MPENPRTVADLFEQLQDLQDELDRWQASGRVQMYTGTDNPNWQNTGQAFTAARTGLQLAVDATRWMQTRPAN